MPVLEPGEILLHSGRATLGFDARRGTLHLSNRRLYYEAHPLGLRGSDWSVPLSEIERVELAMTLWIIPNRIAVTAAGRREELVVDSPAEWISRIAGARKAAYR